MPDQYREKISGPPGTGKTTALLDILDRLLGSGVEPEDIVFTTFTKAGAEEAKQRACARFSIPPARMPYFKTLHAICLGEIGNTKVMGNADWCALGSRLGVGFTLSSNAMEGKFASSTKGDFLMALWSLQRTSNMSLEQAWAKQPGTMARRFPNVSFYEFRHFVETAELFKQEHGKIDFTDMLERFIRRKVDFHCSHVIIDEAQDLSELQWAVCDKLTMHAEQVYVAGDDDQAIHEWAGASPNHFIDLKVTKERVLPQSYRIPSSVHRLATEIIGRVSRRIPKEYAPREYEGVVERVFSEDEIPFNTTDGSWLLLARNRSQLTRFEAACRRQGVLYTGGYGLPEALIKAIRTWRALGEGKEVGKDEVDNLYAHMSQRDRIKRGSKKALKDSRLISFSVKRLQDEYGLLVDPTMPWNKALNMASIEDIAFIETAERISAKNLGRIVEVSTIHGAKGREADNVALLTDVSSVTREGANETPDAEHRVWYVGVTRAKKKLFIVKPSTNNNYSL